MAAGTATLRQRRNFATSPQPYVKTKDQGRCLIDMCRAYLLHFPPHGLQLDSRTKNSEGVGLQFFVFHIHFFPRFPCPRPPLQPRPRAPGPRVAEREIPPCQHKVNTKYTEDGLCREDTNKGVVRNTNNGVARQSNNIRCLNTDQVYVNRVPAPRVLSGKDS